MWSSKKFYLFRKLVKNAKKWSKSNLPLSLSLSWPQNFSLWKGFLKMWMGPLVRIINTSWEDPSRMGLVRILELSHALIIDRLPWGRGWGHSGEHQDALPVGQLLLKGNLQTTWNFQDQFFLDFINTVIFTLNQRNAIFKSCKPLKTPQNRQNPKIQFKSLGILD